MLIERKADENSFVGIFAPEVATHIYPTNLQVDAHNETVIKKVADAKKVKIYTLKAIDVLQEGNLPEGKTMKDITPTAQKDCSGIKDKVKVCLGARVMLTKNLNVERGLVNGAMGNVTHIEWPYFHKDRIEDELPKFIRVKFDNIEQEIDISAGVWRFDALNNVGIIERKQFPLIPAWAVTAHRLQGCTVFSAVAYLGDKIFAKGQPYVCASRVRNIESLLISELNFERIQSKANHQAIAEIETLRRLPRNGPGRRRL